jgi:hypothetical protein
MADRSRDDLSPATPSSQDEKHVPSRPPERDTAEKPIENREKIEEDERLNDRFQATDN